MDPTGIRNFTGHKLASRPEDIKGKTVGLFDIGRWLTFSTVLRHYKEVLVERYEAKDVILVDEKQEAREKGTSREQAVKDLAGKIDVAIIGLGN